MSDVEVLDKEEQVECLSSSDEKGDFWGNVALKADATGCVLFPNGFRLDSLLRIHHVKEFNYAKRTHDFLFLQMFPVKSLHSTRIAWNPSVYRAFA